MYSELPLIVLVPMKHADFQSDLNTGVASLQGAPFRWGEEGTVGE